MVLIDRKLADTYNPDPIKRCFKLKEIVRMIEVEKKFVTNQHLLKTIEHHATFLQEKIFTDIYYDTKEYALTTQDRWLRQRQGIWEFKIGLKNNKSSTDLYREVIGAAPISLLLMPELGAPLEKLIAMGTLEPFSELLTRRKKFRIQRGEYTFNIDIDSATSGDFSYSLTEIEMMVEDEKESKQACECIDALAKEFHLSKDSPPLGKLPAYLKEYSPNHFYHLCRVGVIRNFETYGPSFATSASLESPSK